jgi:CRP/FNR family cyclic AMP-dependent transcriptional regulator
VSAQERRAALAVCPLFGGIGSDALDQLADSCSSRTARTGDTIIEEGEQGDCLFVVTAGRLRAEKRTPSGDIWTVRFLEGGDTFGELALLNCAIRSASVVAESDCTLLVISRERFLAFGDRHAAAGLVVTRRLAERLAASLLKATDDAVTLFSALVHEIERRL